jgi:UDP-N-acetylmuramate--alanine ligase
MDADHLDIYGTSDAIKESFVEFANKVKDKSRLFITKELPLEGVTVAVNEDAVYSAVNVRIDELYIFDVKHQMDFKRFSLWITWEHKIMML